MTKGRSFFSGLRKRFGGQHDTVTLTPSERLRLSGRGLRVPIQDNSFVVEMGKQTVHICQDIPLDDAPDKS